MDLLPEPEWSTTAFADDMGVVVSGRNSLDPKITSGKVTKEIGDELRKKDLTLEPL